MGVWVVVSAVWNIPVLYTQSCGYWLYIEVYLYITLSVSVCVSRALSPSFLCLPPSLALYFFFCISIIHTLFSSPAYSF